ncbi:MAG: aspartate aminotransferase family protein [Salibacteraceae bacterium]
MLANTSPLSIGLKVKSANGSWVYDNSGKRYLDFISGVGVNNLGHNIEEINQAVTQQMNLHSHVMVYGEFIHNSVDQFATKLASLLPQSLNTIYPLNSGTEANEAAIKLVRKATGRTEIISFVGAYHGNTTGSMSISYKESKKAPFRPLMPGTQFIELNNFDHLNKITSNAAGVFLETIQGDAGVQVPTINYIKALRNRCSEVGALLVLDEIQCGYGRTGTFSAFEQFNIVPDVLTLGKALGGGLPIGALVSNDKIMSSLETDPLLGHITTFGGNPVVCAAALAGLNYFTDNKVVDCVEAKGELIENLLSFNNNIKAFRRKGLMIGIELESEKQVNYLILEAKKHGLLLFWFLSVPNGFRISPPLTISESEIEFGCEVILEILGSLPS